MTNSSVTSDETRDIETLAAFVAAAMAEKPLAWQHVEFLKDACALVESQHRMHASRIGPGSLLGGDWR